MATPVTMPVLGLTMEEGTVAEWLKREGETVSKDEPLLRVEMDKGTVEVPAPASGVLRRIVVQPGATVPIRTLIAEIGEPGEVLVASTAASAAPDAGTATLTQAEPSGTRAEAPSGPSGTRAEAASGAGLGPRARSLAAGAGRLFASPRARMRARAIGVDLAELHGSGPHGRIVEADVLAAGAATDSRVLATPLARRLAQEHGVDIGAIRGTGPGGRITQDDVLRAPAATRPASAEAVGAGAVGARTADAAAASRRGEVGPRGPSAEAGERGPSGEVTEAGVEPLSRIRRITADRMAASAQMTARVSLFLEADFSEAARFRNQLQPEFARLGVPKLPWDAIIARAAALALVEHRAVLAQWVDGQGLRRLDAAHVGVAVALEPEGLVVPVLRDAEKRSLRELAADLLEVVDRARAGRLSPDEMRGGTFTITNLGAYRIDGFTPIINPPETAILGVGRIADKPVVIDGKIEARTMCTLSLSFDHRVVDGAPAAAFLARLAELLERPYALLGI